MARTTNYADVIRQRLASDPALAARVNDAALNARIAAQIFSARTKAGLTQSQLAVRVGTTQSVIARLEDADYEGHSLRLLKKIACALGQSLRVELSPAAPAPRPVVKKTSVRSPKPLREKTRSARLAQPGARNR
jgi:transcriptional regulator with XRE-family HTH domain